MPTPTTAKKATATKKAPPKMYRANTSAHIYVNGVKHSVGQGGIYPASNPAVKAHPDLFTLYED